MTALISILVLMIFVLIFGGGLLFLVSLVGPKPRYSDMKDTSYECGIIVQETGSSKVPIKFYLTAILFILFDIEIIFMYPWAINFTDFISAGHGLYALTSMGFFIFIFIYGLFWIVKSQALEWE